jgi:hypothetical protein
MSLLWYEKWEVEWKRDLYFFFNKIVLGYKTLIFLNGDLDIQVHDWLFSVLFIFFFILITENIVNRFSDTYFD